MLGFLARSASRNAFALCRSFSAAPRHLRTKGVVSPKNTYPKGLDAPCYAYSDVQEDGQHDLSIVREDVAFDMRNHSQEIEKLRLAGQIAKKVSLFAGSLVKPGVTLDWIDKTVLDTLQILISQTHEYALSLGYYPSCLGKDGFPKSISISVNEVVCHAIPDDTVLENGDIVKIDLVMYAGGFHGDTCRTFPCGEVDQKGLHLIETTQKCLDAAIKICRPGQDYFQIGRTIQQLANKEGFNVYVLVSLFQSRVEDYCGHGIGHSMHMLPYILHFDNQYGGKMMESCSTEEGMTRRPSIHDRADAGGGQQQGVHLEGRMDGRHGGSWKVRAVRAHDYYSQGRGRDFDMHCL